MDTDVLEFSFDFGSNPLMHVSQLACGLPLTYAEPPVCEYETKITGVWVRQVDGLWRVTSRGTLLQNARFQRDDLHIVSIDGLMVPILWNMLTPAEQAQARACGVTMTTTRDIPVCGDLRLGRLSYQPPPSNAIE